MQFFSSCILVLLEINNIVTYLIAILVSLLISDPILSSLLQPILLKLYIKKKEFHRGNMNNSCQLKVFIANHPKIVAVAILFH